MVCKGGSEEKRTRAVPASECHRREGEGVSNANLKMKMNEREEESLGSESSKTE